MPSGYLKRYVNEVGRKKGRGGSSHRAAKAKCTNQPNNDCERHARDGATDKPRKTTTVTSGHDFVLTSKERITQANNVSKRAPGRAYPTGECPICFNVGPVIQLSSKCSWHEAACRDCLRRIYVTDAKSYPLTCFHPQCRRPISCGSMYRHNLFDDVEERQECHDRIKKAKQEEDAQKQMELLQKVLSKKPKTRIVSCPHCYQPRLHRKPLVRDNTLKCKKCRQVYLISPDYGAIRALERQGPKDKFGGYQDGWARCPHCGVLISKGAGCSHMICGYCHKDFDWREAKGPPHALVPEEQIYLWW